MLDFSLCGALFDAFCTNCLCNCNIFFGSRRANPVTTKEEEEKSSSIDSSPKAGPRVIDLKELNGQREVHLSNEQEHLLSTAIERMLCVYLKIDIEKQLDDQAEIARIQDANRTFLAPRTGGVYRLFLILMECQTNEDVLNRKWDKPVLFEQRFLQAAHNGLLEAIDGPIRLISLAPTYLCDLAELASLAFSEEELKKAAKTHLIHRWVDEPSILSAARTVSKYQKRVNRGKGVKI